MECAVLNTLEIEINGSDEDDWGPLACCGYSHYLVGVEDPLRAGKNEFIDNQETFHYPAFD